MKILAIDASAKSASACVCEIDGARERILSSQYINCGLTHSQTLLPMIDGCLKSSGLSLDDMDIAAVTHGPGSFTGIRIGIATVQGLVMGTDLKAVGVSTLEAIAMGGRAYSTPVICAVMDARQRQVYNALFRFSEGKPMRITEDRAISLDDLNSELSAYEEVLFIGDGAELTYAGSEHCGKLLACEPLLYQTAFHAARIACDLAADGAQIPPLRPDYLRPVHISERKNQTPTTELR